MQGDLTSVFPWGVIYLSNKTVTSHYVVTKNITWSNVYFFNPGIYGRMKKNHIPMCNEWQQSRRADIKNSLFFSTSELFLPETNSEKLKSFSSWCMNLIFKTCVTHRDNLHCKTLKFIGQ